MEYAVLYNPHSGGGNGHKIAKKIEPLMGNNTYVYHDLTKIESLENFLAKLPSKISIILTGGDGSLNAFINSIDTSTKRNIYFYASGSGNDFARDIGVKKRSKPILINDYIKNLPTACIKGKTYRFINCVGSGMDGYCCGEVERLRKISKRRGNYFMAALKALVYSYKPCTAYVNADGIDYSFKNTWLVPTMNGRFFGGGFMAAPKQNRHNTDGTISLVAMHSNNFIKIITAFLLMLKGKHVWFKDMIHTIEGHHFKVKLDRSATLQIDGEIIPDVTEYTVSSAKIEVKK